MTVTHRFLCISLMLLIFTMGHQHLQAQEQFPHLIAWSPDSARLAASIANGALVIENGRVISRCFLDGTISALGFAPDNQTLYLGTSEGSFIACDATKGRKPGIQTQTLPRPEAINRFEFNQDGSRFFIATGTQSPGTLYAYDSSLTQVGAYDPFGFITPAPLFLPDGTLMAFSHEGDVITVLRDNQPTAQITLSHSILRFATTPDGHYLFAMLDPIGVAVFDLATGAYLYTLEDAFNFTNISGQYASLFAKTSFAGVNLATGERIVEFSEENINQSVFDTEGVPVLLTRDNTSGALQLYQYDQSTTPISISAPYTDRLYFFMGQNLLLVAETAEGTDVAVYSLPEGEHLVTHIFGRQIDTSPQQIAGHIFTVLGWDTLAIFDLHTGELLHQREFTDARFYVPQPNGEGYAIHRGTSVMIQPLNGEQQIINLPQ